MIDTGTDEPQITADLSPNREGSRLQLQLPVLERLQVLAGPTYNCPGESEPISRAVHISRQARFYPGCRQCPHADSAGRAALPAGHEDRTAARNSGHFGTVWAEGIRGVYLNEIGRPEAERMATAIAALLWEQQTRRGRDESDPTISRSGEPVGPEVVVARDSRASSPDIACGVVQGLRRMSCHVVELGVTSRPSLDFAVYHLRSSAGIYVTGTGGAAGVTGLDVVGPTGVPWSHPGQLDRVADWKTAPAGRPARHGGTLQSFDPAAPERAEFQRHLQGLRQCRVGAMVDDPALARMLPSWFSESACEIVPFEIASVPFGRQELAVDVRRQLRTLANRERLSLLVRIAADGRCVQLLDEVARPVDPSDWLLRIAERQIGRIAMERVVVGTNLPAVARGRLKAHGTEVVAVAPTQEALVSALIQSRAPMAADGYGRIWFADHYPLCHGFVTLTHLVRLAAEQSQPVSHWAA